MENDFQTIHNLEEELGIKLSEGTDYILKNRHIVSLRLNNLNLEEIPDSIFDLDKLEILNLSGNNIKEIPNEINRLSGLK